MVGSFYSQFCRSILVKRASPLDARQMGQSAVVFSPHYDDETLGVGGTLIQKRSRGAAVYLVFMTDGSRSHAQAMDGFRLSRMRRREALNAAAALGVPENNVFFLDFPETRLAQHSVAAVERVANLLSDLRCDQVFVPSTLEPLLWSADHNVTTEVVFQALARVGDQPEIFEYLVWFWYQWPWVPFQRGDVRQLLKLTWRGRLGLSMWTGLNTAVPIADVLSQKRVALDQYRSQMTRLSLDKPWPVLSDVSRGEFLKHFFQPSEFFRRYKYAELPNGDNNT